MPSFDKIAKAFLEELRQARTQINANQETIISQNARMLDLLQQIKNNTSTRENPDQ